MRILDNCPVFSGQALRKKTKLATLAVAASMSFAGIEPLIAEPLSEAAPIPAANFVEDIGASERVNFSGKLRMLSQRIPAAACNNHAGVLPDQSRAMLLDAAAEFELIVGGLRNGNEDLNMIGVETDRKILHDLNKLDEIWNPLREKIGEFVSTTGTSDQVALIAEQSAPLLETAKHLVTMVSGEYSDPTALVQAKALVIDIAGRQRMLAQRISKNACLIASGISVERAQTELAGAAKIYEASAKALRHGHPTAGIIAPPTEEIAMGLQNVLDDWNSIQPILQQIKDAGGVSAEDRSALFTMMNSLTGQMNTLVGSYSDESKLNL